MRKHITTRESGALTGATIASITLLVLVILFGSVMIWALVNYFDQKNNVDKKVNEAVEIAKRIQKEEDQREFDEREKSPYRIFQGPSEFGSISFQYPKTWSAYVVEESENYEVAFNPLVVPVQDGRDDNVKPLPLRVKVEAEQYTEFMTEFQELVVEGKVKSQPVEVSGQLGNRLDGQLAEGVSGSMIVFKVRDKTMSIAVESQDYVKDFNEIVLKSLVFSP